VVEGSEVIVGFGVGVLENLAVAGGKGDLMIGGLGKEVDLAADAVDE
jgi:hypothetical protein